MASSVVRKRHTFKVTEGGSKGGHHESNDDEVCENTCDLFVDSDSDESTVDNMVTDKGNTKTGSDNKRKAENDDDNTDDGKKQKGGNKE